MRTIADFSNTIIIVVTKSDPSGACEYVNASAHAAHGDAQPLAGNKLSEKAL